MYELKLIIENINEMVRFGVTVERVILSDTTVRLIISRLVSVSGLVTGTGRITGLAVKVQV